jgi:prephenate dehydrogenase
MAQIFEHVGILGLGLMGGSLGLALRQNDLAGLVSGYDPDRRTLHRAEERGAIDLRFDTPEDAVVGCDLVVLAAPVLAVRELMRAIAPLLDDDATVMDLCGTKTQVMAWARELLPVPANFVGAHPMAGSERSGIDAADAGLYRHQPWCLTPILPGSQTAFERAMALVDALEPGTVSLVSPEEHDAAVASISHLPLLAATALTLTATTAPTWETASFLAAGGFRDTTRVASGNPRMARDVCLTNTQPILDSLDAYIATLQRLREAVASADMDLEGTFAEARRQRDWWLNAHPS